MIWQAASVFVGQEILLASPAAVLKRLFTLVTEPVFWQSLLFSGARIGAGFLLGAAAGIAGAALAGRFSIAEELLTPLVAAVKAVPVASFVILILIWVSSKNLSVVISFLMVFPILYTNTRNSACLYTGSEIPSETKSQPKDSSTKPRSGSESQKKRPALLSLLQPAASGVLLQWKTDRQVQLLQFPPPHQEGIRLRCVLRKTAGTARRPVLLQA